MGELSVEIVETLNYLMPGFLTAWIFYGLTAYRRPSQFERIVQALVFTGIIQVASIAIRSTMFGESRPFGVWGEEIKFVTAWVVAIILGLVISWFAHRDWIHAVLRGLGLTANTSYPSQWYSAFKQIQSDVILNLKDGNRLRGWPFEWPDHPKEGQFRICDARWICDDGSEIMLDSAECLLIPAANVDFVEFIGPAAKSRFQRFGKWVTSLWSKSSEREEKRLNEKSQTPCNANLAKESDKRQRYDGNSPPQIANTSIHSSATAEEMKGVPSNATIKKAKPKSRTKRR